MGISFGCWFKNVVEAIAIEELKNQLRWTKRIILKEWFYIKDRLIAVLDIRDFINEEITNEELTNIILFQYDKDNIEHCVGILVSSNWTYLFSWAKINSTYPKSLFRKWNISSKSLVDINDYEVSQVAMLLDIKKDWWKLNKKI